MRNINVKNIIDKSTGFFLLCYIISAAAFENYAPTSKLASYTLYVFVLLALMDVFNKKKIRFTHYNIAIFLYGILLVISFFYTPDADYGIQTLYWYYTCAALTFFVTNYVDSVEKIYFLIKAYILSGMVLAFFLLSFYGMKIFSLAANSIHGIRIGGQLGNENLIGMSLSISCVFAIYMVFYHSITKKEIIICMLDIAVCFPLILLTGSKKALFLIIFGILLLVLCKTTDRVNIVKRLGFLLSGVIFLAICYVIITKVKAFWFMTERINEFIGTLQGKGVSDSDTERIYMIKAGLKAFGRSPIFGNGVAYSRHVFGTYAHNNYIEILMNTGLTGLLTYYSIYLISILYFYLKRSYNLQLKIIALFIIVSFLILEVGMVSYYNRYFQILLAATSIILGTNNKFWGETYGKN